MNIQDLTITSLETITAFDITSGSYLFTLDELQNASIANSQEKSDITGKGGRKLSSLKRNKAVTISGANGFVSGGLLEMQSGGKFENKVTEVMWTDYLTVDDQHKAQTNYKAVGTAGAEIETVYTKDDKGVISGTLTQDASVTEGKFTYDPETKALTFNENIAKGTEIVVYYKRKITADTLDNMSDNYSKKCTLYVDAFAEDKCANVYRVQFYIPKADFSGDFTIEMGDNQTVHNFEAEGLAGSCGAGGKLWGYTVFGENAADAS